MIEPTETEPKETLDAFAAAMLRIAKRIETDPKSVHDAPVKAPLRRRKVFIEYVLLAGVNDRVEQARTLAGVLDPKVFKVNLIPYNPTGAFTGSSPKAIAAFESELRRSGIPTTVRLTRGRDIAAACGQLAASS